MDQKSAERKIGRACIALLIRHPFFGSLVYQHEHLVSEKVPTAAVTPNGKMIFNPGFVNSCNLQELIFLLAHEVMHVVFAHALRRGSRDHELYNIACDAVINDILIAENVGKFIEGGILMPGAAARTSENIYAELADQHSKLRAAHAREPSLLEHDSPLEADKAGEDGGNGACCGSLDIRDLPECVPAMTSEQINEQISLGRISIGQAASLARSRGMMSGRLGRFVDSVLKSRMPWHQLLERYLVSKAGQRFTWRRPNRRRLSVAYLPRRERMPNMGEVVLGIDVSASISDSQTAAFFGHCQAIFELCHPRKVYVVYCTVKVEAVDVFERGEELTPRKSLWYGGTDMRAVMAWIRDNSIEPDACITFTDGVTPFPKEKDAPCPLVWVLVSQVRVPEGTPGEVIYATDDLDR